MESNLSVFWRVAVAESRNDNQEKSLVLDSAHIVLVHPQYLQS